MYIYVYTMILPGKFSALRNRWQTSRYGHDGHSSVDFEVVT